MLIQRLAILKFTYLAVTLLASIAAAAQSQHKVAPTDTVSLEQFSAQLGQKVTITDYKMPDISVGMNRLYSRVRKATVAGITRYYYIFSKNALSSNFALLFALNYDEIVEMQRAIVQLKSETDGALRENPFYKESRYATYGIVRVGYFVEDSKIRWFVDSNPNSIGRYRQSFGSFNLADISPLEKALEEAKQKIDQLISN